jgi:hypothetical protein
VRCGCCARFASATIPRAARLSPRDALLARIPPPEVISRLELLAYGGVSPEPSELEQLEKELQL